MGLNMLLKSANPNALIPLAILNQDLPEEENSED